MSTQSLPPEYFEGVYRDSDDPWGFRTRWYEQRKYALTLASLPRPRYRRGLEPGCSVGVLTEMLAARCDDVVATDVVDSVLARTRNRLRDLTNVDMRRWSLGAPWTDLGTFDLVVLSEVAYYLDADALRSALADVVSHLEPGGTVVCVHWHRSTDYPLSGATVHDIVRATPGLVALSVYRDADFVIDVLARDDGDTRSVAQREGIAG